MIAQTVAGKFETADILFMLAFILAVIVIVVEAVRKADAITLLWRVAIALMICAFWIS